MPKKDKLSKSDKKMLKKAGKKALKKKPGKGQRVARSNVSLIWDGGFAMMRITMISLDAHSDVLKRRLGKSRRVIQPARRGDFELLKRARELLRITAGARRCAAKMFWALPVWRFGAGLCAWLWTRRLSAAIRSVAQFLSWTQPSSAPSLY
jgi:hypothetical protein